MAAKDYTLIFGSGAFFNNIKIYVVDELADRDFINVSQLLPGSKVYVINDAQWYILSNEMEWEPYSEGGQGGSGLPEGVQGQYVGYNSEGEGVALSPDTEPTSGSNKLITSGAVYSAIAAFPKGLVYKGAVSYYSNLPASGQTIGDAYTVKYTGSSGTETDGTEYAWGNYEGTLQWIPLGPDLTRILALIDTKQDQLTFDNTPTQNSDNPVKSGGIYDALATKEDVPIAHELTLASTDWSSAEQTVEVPGVLADEKKQLIVITPKAASRTAFETAGIRAISQAADALTFKYNNAPSSDIDVFATVIDVRKNPPKSYLTFSSPSSFTLATKNNTKNWDGTLEYSTDADTWQTWSGTSAISSSNDGKLYLRGIANTKITGNFNRGWRFTAVDDISCIGNIENLLDYATVALDNHPTMANDCFAGLFYGCTSLTTAPILPATTLSSQCYYIMFSGCTSLTSAPALPATSLNTYCYGYMFQDCSALVAIPELPSDALRQLCYSNMFNGCSQIKLSETQTGEYTQAYHIGRLSTGSWQLEDMFTNTGGSFTGSPSANTTYYLSNTNTIVPANS